VKFSGVLKRKKKKWEGGGGGHLLGYNLMLLTYSWTGNSKGHVSSVILYVVIKCHFSFSIFFIFSFPTIIPSIIIDEQFSYMNTYESSEVIFY